MKTKQNHLSNIVKYSTLAGVLVGIILAIIFLVYSNKLANPEQIILSAEEKLAFEQTIANLYPTQNIQPLPYPVTPAQLELYCDSAILIDASNGCILYEKNADEIIPPASMTKLVVMYVVFQEIETGRISLQDIVPLPPESWAINAPPMSSLMFLGEGQNVTLEELLLGLAVASGNDAAIAVAHYVSGSVENFVERMNQEMQNLGLKNTRFVEPSGYSELNLTTAREFAAFTKVYIERYPEALDKFHSQKSISYPQQHNLAPWHKENNTEQPIFQPSTNKLLGVLEGCDGLKTGFIFESGYNLSLTAKRNGSRYISITMKGPGSGSVEGNRYRVADATTLMEWAFTCFATRPRDTFEPFTLPVLGGTKNAVAVLPAKNQSLTVPAIVPQQTPNQTAKDVTYTVTLPTFVQGEIACGDVIGKITYELAGTTLAEIPLVAVNNVAQSNWFKKAIDKVASVFW
ncbi:MAG: D-alanyl-D-alanine carboxypeptidase [Spirochaetaceae bacterium]|nr:D-alanyl-D-alanine carboxypeptidase [Spirochaetaceae bacterium]